MSDKTELTREEVEALLTGATPGPWRSAWEDQADTESTPQGEEGPVIYSAASIDPADADVVAGTWYDGPLTMCRRPDAALIAAAPTIARQLVAEMDDNARLRDELAEARATLAAERGLAANQSRGAYILGYRAGHHDTVEGRHTFEPEESWDEDEQLREDAVEVGEYTRRYAALATTEPPDAP